MIISRLGKRFRGRHGPKDAPANLISSAVVKDDSATPRIRINSENSTASAISDVGPVSLTQRADRKNERMGLHVAYNPPGPHSIDIVFVHGLGGTSQLSWSYDRNLANFWPKEWLPLEPGFKDARILTFGYEADFRSQAKDIFDISTFSQSLLFDLKHFCGEDGEALPVGKVPIIFVAHSMGGLVVKKAYILGGSDDQYKDIINNVRSIVFLATPHRGSNLAEMLNNILSLALIAPKQYVNDLAQNSITISHINDQFRHVADKLDIVSFYETLPTSLRVKSMIIVQRDSAVLGYPGEICSPMNADHHGVSKFKSSHDANYFRVRNVLKALVEKTSKPVGTTDNMASPSQIDDLREKLGVKPMPLDKLTSAIDKYVPNSCDWILSDPGFEQFMNSNSKIPTVLNITGGPGTGKTIMSSFLVTYFKNLNLNTQFWYFQYDDNTFRSNRQCLLSLAFQIMANVPAYTRKLSSRKAGDLETITQSDFRSLWQKLFLDILDTLDANAEPLYWVIDAVDESESAHAFFQLLCSLKTTRFPLRIVLLTRSQTVTKQYDELRKRFTPLRVSQLALVTPKEKLELFIDSRMAEFYWNDDGHLRNQIRNDLLRKSRGSFLWLSLVMGDLADCDSEEDVTEALERIPAELTDVYQRLEESIVAGRTKKDKVYATAILSWVTCAERPLTETELCEALQEHKLLQLGHTINRLCGDFVVISKKNVVTMVHHTARDYILNSATTYLRVDSADAHTTILDKCLSVIMDPKFKWKLRRKGLNDNILRYCCLSWANHLVQSNVADGPRRDHYVQLLKKMFSSQSVLVWVEAVAMTKQLNAITATSRALLIFTKLLQDRPANEYPGLRPLEVTEYLFSWAEELVYIVGRFGSHLLRCPSAIYTIVPLFCPPTSALSKLHNSSQFSLSPITHNRQNRHIANSRHDAAHISPRVTGISNNSWGDVLTKLTFGSDQRPTKVFGLDSSFGVLCMDSIRLYDASTTQEIFRFKHDERIITAEFSSQGTLLVTAGTKSVKIWDTSDGSLLKMFPNPVSLISKRQKMRAQSVTFSEDASELVMFCIDGTIRRRRVSEADSDTNDCYEYDDNYNVGGGDAAIIEANITSASASASGDGDGWTVVELYESGNPAAAQASRLKRGSAKCVSFSRGGSQVAASYRIWPTSVWDTETGELVGRCEPPGHLKHASSRHFDHPNVLGWNLATDHVVGIYQNGTVFKWDPAERYAEEMETTEDIMATNLAVSPDGRLLVTSQRDGSLKVFNFETFAPLFNLTSMSQPTSMAFSPDRRRIYDIRGECCNVWQPHALIRVADQDDLCSDSVSSSYDHSMSGLDVPAIKTESLQPVTAIAAPGNMGNAAYAFGNDGGSLKYYSDAYVMKSIRESLNRHTSTPPLPVPADIVCGNMGVTCIAFSSDGTTMATATRDNQVAVRKLLPDGNGFDAQSEIRFDAEGSVMQVVLDSSSRLLLVHTLDATRVWDLLTKQIVHWAVHDGSSCQWLISPTTELSFIAVQSSMSTTLAFNLAGYLEEAEAGESSPLFYINHDQLDTVNWAAVAPRLSRKLHQDLSRSGRAIGPSLSNDILSLDDEMTVHKVLPTPGFTNLLIQMSTPGSEDCEHQDRWETRFFLLDISRLTFGGDKDDGRDIVTGYDLSSTMKADDITTLDAQALPQPILDLIEIPLGFMLGAPDSGSSAPILLAFIDREFWVRTWRLDDVGAQSTKRHFFIPSDWINMDYLDLAMVTPDGRFLCPRNGEVAVIHNGLSGLLYADL